jgi:hypothetical protein
MKDIFDAMKKKKDNGGSIDDVIREGQSVMTSFSTGSSKLDDTIYAKVK